MGAGTKRLIYLIGDSNLLRPVVIKRNTIYICDRMQSQWGSNDCHSFGMTWSINGNSVVIPVINMTNITYCYPMHLYHYWNSSCKCLIQINSSLITWDFGEHWIIRCLFWLNNSTKRCSLQNIKSSIRSRYLGSFWIIRMNFNIHSDYFCDFWMVSDTMWLMNKR